MTEDKKPCRCSDLCNNFAECHSRKKYTLVEGPVFMGVDLGFGGDKTKAMYINENGDAFEIDGNHLHDALNYAQGHNRHCHFCRKLTETRDETCVVCRLSKQHKGE